MRHLLTVFILTISISLPAREPCVYTATNLQCEDDGSAITNLSFDLTITDNGTIVTANSSVNFTLREKETNIQRLEVGFSEGTVAFDGFPINDGFPYTFVTTGTCENIVGQTLNITNLGLTGSSSPCEVLTNGSTPEYPMITFPSVSNPTPSAPLPTMSQWALIILGMGVVGTTLLVLVRGGNKESIL